MNDNFLEKTASETEKKSNDVTLVISGVPSEIAYDILISSLSKDGKVPEEELLGKIQERISEDGNGFSITYSEIEKYFVKSTSKFTHEVDKHESGSIEENQFNNDEGRHL